MYYHFHLSRLQEQQKAYDELEDEFRLGLQLESSRFTEVVKYLRIYLLNIVEFMFTVGTCNTDTNCNRDTPSLIIITMYVHIREVST